MNIFQKLFRLLFPPAVPEVLWFYIQCKKCGKKLKIRVNPSAELSPDYDTTSGSYSGYYLIKEATDDKCFQLMKIEIKFDQHKQIKEKHIEGGTFITETEFKAS
jgi:hypothetical protein